MQTSLPYDYPNLDAKIRIQKNTKSPLGTVHSISFSPQSTKVQSWTQSWDNLCTKSMLTFFQFSQPAYFCFVFVLELCFFIFIPTFGPNAFLTPLFNPTVCLCWNHITVGHTCRVTEYNRWVIGFVSQQSDKTAWVKTIEFACQSWIRHVPQVHLFLDPFHLWHTILSTLSKTYQSDCTK